jgi:hypothetical protein
VLLLLATIDIKRWIGCLFQNKKNSLSGWDRSSAIFSFLAQFQCWELHNMGANRRQLFYDITISSYDPKY